ncbi:MAG: hypothetical protein GY744_08900 [Gammaproteobacteria bacterium]|nr:hypothetical protein [Gammaproteobacteria bacterium]
MNHPVGIYLKKPGTGVDPNAYARSENLQNGLPEEPVKAGASVGSKQQMLCQSCHSAHGGKPDTPSLLFEHKKNGNLCSNCLDGNDAVVNTDHDLRLTAKQSINKFEHAGACGSCHSMHRAKGTAPFLYSRKVTGYSGEQKIFQRDQLCLDCHREKGIAEKMNVEYFSHPSEDLVLRSDPKIMPLLDGEEKVSEFGAIACITCHEPHHWELHEDNSKDVNIIDNKNGNALNSFLRLKSVENTFCVDCHGIETQLKYKYYHDKLSRDVGVEYIH